MRQSILDLIVQNPAMTEYEAIYIGLIREVSLHIKHERVRVEMDYECDVIKICVHCGIVIGRLHVTRDFNV